MIHYRYEAIDAEGRALTGTVEAPDRAGAEFALAERGLTIVTLLDETAGPGPGGTLADRDVAELVEQLHALTRAGMPLPAGLRAASAELETPALRATFLRLADQLDRGQGLDEALVAEAGRFPGHLQGLVLAGSRTGRLADVLGEMVQGSNLGQELRRKVAASLAYPALILGVVLALTLFICHLSGQIIDGIGLGESFGSAQLSSTTAAMAAITRFVATYDLAILAGLAVAGGVGFGIWRVALSPSARRRSLEAIPLIGPMIRYVALAEFCHLTALLVEARTPLPEAISLAGSSLRDPSLAATCRRVAATVAQGQSLASALQTWADLPAGLGQLLAWGEEGQNLAPSLRFAGDMFETRAESQATFSSQVVGATLLVMILWWIGFAIASIYLPLVFALRMLSG